MSDTSANSRFAQYLDGIVSGEFEGKKKSELAEHFQVSEKTLWNWDQKIDWDWVKTERRKLYAKQIIEVDGAMLKEARKGNTTAAELIYRRFDGYVPTSASLNQELSEADPELVERAKQVEAELRVRVQSDQPGTSPPATA